MAKPGTPNKHGRMRKRPGALTETDKRIALSLKAITPALSATTIARSLNRSPRSVASYLTEARDLLHESAPLVAAHMLQASAIASAKGDSRPAEWILGRLSAVDEGGKEVRIVERDTQVQHAQGLTVNIALPVGNIPRLAIPADITTPLPIEGQCVVVSDSIIKT